MMPDTIRWGVISTANIGAKRVIPAIKKAVNGEVVAVASRSLDKAKAFADEHGFPKAYGSYEELFADPDVDAIYNPLPNSLHAKWSIKAAAAGKPTLCEKPFASDADEAQQIVDAFVAHNVLLAEAFMYRFHPQNQRAQQMVQDGAIGRPLAMSSGFTFSISDEANIRLSKALAGGALMDVGCYCINAMRFISGEEPVEAHAIADFGAETDVDERISGVLRFPSGMLGHLDAGLRVHRAHFYEVRGSKGRLYLPQSFTPDADAMTYIYHERDDNSETIEVPPVDQYQLMIEDFGDALLNGRPPRFLPQDAVNNMRVVDRLLASARANAS